MVLLKSSPLNKFLTLTFFLFSIYVNAQSYYLVSSSENLNKELNTIIPNTNGLKFSDLNNERDTDTLNHIASSLNEVQRKIILHYNGKTITEDVTVFIRKGVYKDANLTWAPTSPQFKIKIINYGHEEVIFDGTEKTGNFKARFLKLEEKRERTNFYLEGITIQNFINGISLGEGIRSSENEQCTYNKEVFNSHNSIKNNVFRRIGNKYCKNSTTKNIGYSAIGMSNSNNNIIDSNIFFEIENDQATNPTGIHAIYIINYSKNNTISNNYVSYCSSSAFKMRNGCINTTIDSNYIEKTGSLGFIDTFFCANTEDSIEGVEPCYCPSAIEIPSDTIIMTNNICTFSYPLYNRDTKLLYNKYILAGIKEAMPTNVIDENNIVISGNNSKEKVNSVVLGDIDNDGTQETFVAYNYPAFSKLVRSNTKHPLYMSEIIDITFDWKINGLTFNYFENKVEPTLLTVYNSKTNNETEIWKGTGIKSSKDLDILHKESSWETAAITSGDYNNDGLNEVFISFNSLDKRTVNVSKTFKGNGKDPVFLYDLVHSHNNMKVGALTTIDNTILVAFNTSKKENKETTNIFKGTGTGENSLINLGELYSHPFWKVNSLQTIKDDFNIGYNIYVGLEPLKNNTFKYLEEFSFNELLQIEKLDLTKKTPFFRLINTFKN